MRTILKNILETNTVLNEDGEKRPLHSHIDVDEGRFIQEMIRSGRFTRCLEVGCAYGTSSLFVGEALRDIGGGQLTIIDAFQKQDWENIGLGNIKRAGMADMVTFHEQLSHIALPKILESGARFDFAFIDGQHTFDYVFVDFFYIDQMLDVGGVIVFDDLGYKSIRKVCRYVLANLPYVAVGPATTDDQRSWKRRLAEKAASTFRFGEPLFNPDLTSLDQRLGIPRGRYVAVKKVRPNEMGDGSNGTRHWTFHRNF